VGTGGSSAATDGKASSSSRINGNDNNANAMSKARAQDGGTWSSSKTQTKVKAGEEVGSRTKSMSHVPGEKPVKSTTSSSTEISR
jgi:hypothetical protein